MNRLYAVDVETTGRDAKTASIVSIGAVDIENPRNTFYIECKPWDGAHISDTALKINGFTREALAALPHSESKAIQVFFNWLKRQPGTPLMIAHNAGFDSSFVEEAAKRADIPCPFGIRSIDIHSIVYMHMLRNHAEIPSSLSLNKCLQYFGYAEEPTPHNALTGATCNQIVYQRVLAG